MRTKSPPRLFYLLDRAYRSFNAASDRWLRENAGVPMAQMGAIFALYSQSELSLTQLGRALGLKKAAVSTLVSRLEGAGLVNRLKNPVDERAFKLELTQVGLRAAELALPKVARANRKLLARFSQSELEIVARFLTTIIEETQKGDWI